MTSSAGIVDNSVPSESKQATSTLAYEFDISTDFNNSHAATVPLGSTSRTNVAQAIVPTVAACAAPESLPASEASLEDTLIARGLHAAITASRCSSASSPAQMMTLLIALHAATTSLSADACRRHAMT